MEIVRSYNPAAEAIGDSILVTQAHLLFNYWEDYTQFDPETALEKATKGLCGRGSTYALYFLTKKYSHLFNAMTLIGTYNTTSIEDPNSSPLRHSWEHHGYFMVQDQTGVWYAASPANYRRNEADHIKPFVSTELEQVLGQIVERDGGIWPSADFIKKSVANPTSLPIVTEISDERDAIDSLLIERIFKNERIQRERFNFKKIS